MDKQISETVTENFFRDFYGPKTFIEKSAIPKEYGFKSKKGTDYKGYPDFFLDNNQKDYVIIVEAKARTHSKAINEVQFYMKENTIHKNIVGIAVSGQDKVKLSYFYKNIDSKEIHEININNNNFSDLDSIEKQYYKTMHGDSVSNEELVKILNQLNKRFHQDSKIRDTDRSLFFSGIMIALKNMNFRNTYKNIQAPTEEEVATTQSTVLEAHYLNNAILNAIKTELEGRINNLSKEYSWQDRFSFIKTIDYPLIKYKEIIKTIETKIFVPFENQEKQDILGKAYKIFLKKAGKTDNRNIILTPDHIKGLMVKLARLSVDDVVLDTCTGSGGFLMEAMETLEKLAKNDEDKIRLIKEKQLIGFETDPVLFALACSNMFLHGDGRTNLLYRSSLLDTTNSSVVNNKDGQVLKYIKNLKPTKVIINPPYEKNSSIKFVKQALEYIEPNGKLIIIMPTPTLTSNQNGLSEEILQGAKLDFVIKMPNNLFSEQQRTVNTSIFGFTKTPHKKYDEVIFYRLEDDGFVSIQHKGKIDKFNKWADKESSILDAVFNSKEIPKICEKRKIYNKDGILNCAGITNIRDSKYEMKKVSDLFTYEEGSLQSESCISGEYNFITASDDWKTHNEYTHDQEALIYAVKASGSLGKCQYVNGKFITSDLCIILTPKNQEYPINTLFYECYFNKMRKDIVSDLADGSSKLIIDKKRFMNYYIDYIPIDKQNKIVKELILPLKESYNNYKKQWDRTQNELANLI